MGYVVGVTATSPMQNFLGGFSRAWAGAEIVENYRRGDSLGGKK